MAKSSIIIKADRRRESIRILRRDPEGTSPRPAWFKKYVKFPVRAYNRCGICGRPRAYYRKFGICRICFRKMAHLGQIPGVKKASW